VVQTIYSSSRSFQRYQKRHSSFWERIVIDLFASIFVVSNDPDLDYCMTGISKDLAYWLE